MAERSESGASETTVLRGDQPWITNETAAERETTESSNTKPIAYMQALCYYPLICAVQEQCVLPCCLMLLFLCCLQYVLFSVSRARSATLLLPVF